MKRLFLVLIILMLAYGGYLASQTLFPQLSLTYPYSSPINSSVSTIQIGNTTYKLEVADDDNKKIKGLSGRDSLSPNHGMLFIYPTKDRYSFWMKGMQFPLDFVWIDGDTIADLTQDVPRPLTDTYTPIYQPKVPVDKILELNAGEIKKNGFTIGQKVSVTILQDSTQ